MTVSGPGGDGHPARRADDRTRAAGQPDAGKTLTERAYRTLEEQIVTLQLVPGAAVSEALLSRRLRIGRTPIREALQRLARERLVLILPRRGIIVSEIDVTSQLRLLEVRRELERLLARSAARRADPDQRHQFAAIAEGMGQAAHRNDDIAFLRLDRAFNELLSRAARNEYAASAMGLMNGLSRRFWYMHYRKAADLPSAARLHADVAGAIAAGQEGEAAAASDRLMDYIREFARQAVPEDE